MKKVFYILQITLLTMVMQTGLAQEVAEQIVGPTTDKTPGKVYSKSEIAKLPSDMITAFEKKYSDATIEEVVVINKSGIHKVEGLVDGKKVTAYYNENGDEFFPVPKGKDGSSE